MPLFASGLLNISGHGARALIEEATEGKKQDGRAAPGEHVAPEEYLPSRTAGAGARGERTKYLRECGGQNAAHLLVLFALGIIPRLFLRRLLPEV